MKNKVIFFISIFLLTFLLTGCTKQHTHDYYIEWEWGEEVIAIFKCDCGKAPVQRVLASTKEEVLYEADCLKNGKVKVVAKVTFNNSIYETEKIIVTPKKDHDIITTLIEPGFTTEGYKIDCCSNCDYSYKYSNIPPILELELCEDYYAVSGVNIYNNSNIIIPDEYNGLPIKAINSYAFYNCISITSVEISKNVTSIGYASFANCYNLKSIILPFVGNTLDGTKNTHFGYIFGANSDSNNSSYVPTSLKEVVITCATRIDSYAFYKCDHIKSITIPKSIVAIGSAAFSNCNSLENVYYTGTIDSLCKISFKNFESNPMSYAKHFYIMDSNNNYSEVFEIEVPSTVTTIGDYVFYGFENLININISNSVTCIGTSSFDGCLNLASIEISNSLESIGDHAFYECVSLNHIIIPKSVTTIGIWAFYDCTNLTISCESSSRPSGWSSSWNPSHCPVVWGYK